MAFLAAAMPYIALAGTAVSAYGQAQAGRAAEANARADAAIRDRQAKASEAEAQRDAIHERKRAEYLQSRVRAVAASSGAGASDPTIENILGDIGEEGEYNALAALYSGSTDADLSRYAAGSRRREGRAQRRGAYLGAGSTILGGASTFAYR